MIQRCDLLITMTLARATMQRFLASVIVITSRRIHVTQQQLEQTIACAGTALCPCHRKKCPETMSACVAYPMKFWTAIRLVSESTTMKSK
jgi:hypothetical protein